MKNKAILKNRKSQITVFIIIGIILLSISALTLYMTDKLKVDQTKAIFGEVAEVPYEMEPLKVYIEQCLKKTTIPGVYYLAFKGGDFTPLKNESVITENFEVSYGVYGGENTLPSVDDLSYQISSYIEVNLDNCIDDFNSFKSQGLEITAEQPKATTLILEEQVGVKLEYPVTLTREGTSTSASEFMSFIPIRLGYLLAVANIVANNRINNPNNLDLALLSAQGPKITMAPVNKRSMLFSLHDPESNIDNAPFVFMFGAKLPENSAPRLDFIPDKIILLGESFSFDVNATDYENDKLVYFDSSDIFDINQDTGIISFTPAEPGTFNFEIKVVDTEGVFDEEEVQYIVRE
ncbi:cadherin repeat domain-containing protein [Nanoarchaeota archaeon]